MRANDRSIPGCLQRVTEIGRMVFADLRCKAQQRAQESGSHFGNQFFGRIGLLAKAFAKLAVQAGGGGKSSASARALSLLRNFRRRGKYRRTAAG